jgi:hypothetical protein
MSRSKHTRPYEIRAADRLRAPYEPRGRGDPASERATGRALKLLGLAPEPTRRAFRADEAVPLPRIVVKRPHPGHIHPLRRADVVAALSFFGESCVYGLRSISLISSAGGPPDRVRLGGYVAPGRVLLFDQPPSPWQLAGSLSPATIERLVRAGADVDVAADGLRTVVTWPGATLRDFLLFDGLMHEIGHHVLQHARGKRDVRVLRTRDHEELADQFARRCRALYAARGPAGS